LAATLWNAIDASEYHATVLVEIDCIVSDETVVRPDVIVLCGPAPARHVEQPPALVAKILSATRDRDLTVKRHFYEASRTSCEPALQETSPGSIPLGSPVRPQTCRSYMPADSWTPSGRCDAPVSGAWLTSRYGSESRQARSWCRDLLRLERQSTHRPEMMSRWLRPQN